MVSFLGLRPGLGFAGMTHSLDAVAQRVVEDDTAVVLIVHTGGGRGVVRSACFGLEDATRKYVGKE